MTFISETGESSSGQAYAAGEVASGQTSDAELGQVPFPVQGMTMTASLRGFFEGHVSLGDAPLEEATPDVPSPQTSVLHDVYSLGEAERALSPLEHETATAQAVQKRIYTLFRRGDKENLIRWSERRKISRTKTEDGYLWKFAGKTRSYSMPLGLEYGLPLVASVTTKSRRKSRIGRNNEGVTFSIRGVPVVYMIQTVESPIFLTVEDDDPRVVPADDVWRLVADLKEPSHGSSAFG